MSLPPLRAALAAHAPGGEIIVVDNGSDDDTREWVAAEFPEVRVIALPTNEGFAGATNRGARDSLHPTLILLNNDMVVEPDFIAPLLDAMDAEPTAFGVSCQIDFIDKGKPRWETGKVHARWKWGTVTLFHLDRWRRRQSLPGLLRGRRRLGLRPRQVPGARRLRRGGLLARLHRGRRARLSRLEARLAVALRAARAWCTTSTAARRAGSGARTRSTASS